MPQVKVTVTDGQKALIRERAGMHGKPMSKYLLHAALPDQPGSVSEWDAWWDSKTAHQREAIWKWLDQKVNKAEKEAQMEQLPLETEGA